MHIPLPVALSLLGLLATQPFSAYALPVGAGLSINNNNNNDPRNLVTADSIVLNTHAEVHDADKRRSEKRGIVFKKPGSSSKPAPAGESSAQPPPPPKSPWGQQAQPPKSAWGQTASGSKPVGGSKTPASPAPAAPQSGPPPKSAWGQQGGGNRPPAQPPTPGPKDSTPPPAAPAPDKGKGKGKGGKGNAPWRNKQDAQDTVPGKGKAPDQGGTPGNSKAPDQAKAPAPGGPSGAGTTPGKTPVKPGVQLQKPGDATAQTKPGEAGPSKVPASTQPSRWQGSKNWEGHLGPPPPVKPLTMPKRPPPVKGDHHWDLGSWNDAMYVSPKAGPDNVRQAEEVAREGMQELGINGKDTVLRGELHPPKSKLGIGECVTISCKNNKERGTTYHIPGRVDAMGKGRYDPTREIKEDPIVLVDYAHQIPREGARRGPNFKRMALEV